MTLEEDCSESTALLRLRVSTEVDPNVLARVLGCFQNINVTPRRVVAEFANNSVMHLQIDVSGVSEARLSLISAKIAQSVAVLNACWHRL
jgi:hypothetical protein